MFKAGVNTTFWQWIGNALDGYITLAEDIFSKAFYMNLIGLLAAFLVLFLVLRFLKQRG